MSYRQVLNIIQRHGFIFERQRGSHRTYRGEHSGRAWRVTLAYSQLGEDVKPGTLSAIIRQSGLPKDAFR